MRRWVVVLGVVVVLAMATVATLQVYGQEQEEGRVTDGLVVLYEFDEGAGEVVKDKSGVGEPLNLTISDMNGVTWLEGGGLAVTGDKVAIRTDEAATKLIEALQASNQITIEAVLTPQDTTQEGPARIVSLSRDPGVRNFTLGQTKEQYILRLRTSETDKQGQPDIVTDEGVVEAKRQHVVVTYDGFFNAGIFVDGELKRQGVRSGDFSTWDDSFRLVLANEDSLDRQWRGKIELVAIYSRALSRDEVKRNFAALDK